MAKIVGMVMVASGIAIILFLAISWQKNSKTIISPIPESNGVKVVPISPNE